MPPSAPTHRTAGWRHPAWVALCTLCVGACASLQPGHAPAAPAAAAAPEPAREAAEPAPVTAPVPQVDQATPADLAARRLLDYHERLRRLSAVDLGAEIARLSALVASGNPPASPADVLALALALAQQHNPGDLARAASLLEPIAQVSEAEPQPWQALARLLQARISEERRLEEELERQANQRRDTQRTIQQLTEKLEALKAIERSMTAHPAASPPAGSAAAPGSEPAAPTPPRTP